MRVFVAYLGASSYWARNLCEPLIRMGHDVIQSALDWDLPMRHVGEATWMRQERPRMSERLLEEVRTAHQQKALDIFLSYFYNVHVEPEAIRQIRKLGILAVNFYCNAAHQFHLVSEIAPAYDFCWVPEQQALPYYKAVGANALHIQMGANPGFYRPIPGVHRDIPVLFSGSLYADRARWLAGLLRRGIPVRIYTGAFAHGGANNEGGEPAQVHRSFVREALQDLQLYGPAYLMRRVIRMAAARKAVNQIRSVAGPPPDDEEMLVLFARSQIVLNFSNVYDGGGPGGKVKAHVRLRDFEVPMCRALYFPQYCDELPLYYDIEREVVAWKSLGELVAKIQYYLDHPQEAERIREAGYRRALKDHTWERRYEQLFQAIGMGR